MKALEILTKTRSQITDEHQFATIYDEAIKELETLQQSIKSVMINYDDCYDKLVKSQKYIVELENRLKGSK